MAQNDGQVKTPVWFTPFPADPANYGQMDFIEPGATMAWRVH